MLNLFQHLLVIHTDPDPECWGQGDNARFEIIQPLIRISNAIEGIFPDMKLFDTSQNYVNLYPESKKIIKVFILI